ncbi:endolytic transglycosylase MltG [Alcanivorax profundi]|uniref:Endolytic murein transglycosylase n=1 Tax=Alcanivorax profundi TaxID=2338368 RepID=A0A418Y2K3_9GAMM|nr:endolytic transglycosylase MltG [Alcanivorax profundi]RJG19759.1 endolytic transglycosylase MltG [Alcanivorax profundi]
MRKKIRIFGLLVVLLVVAVPLAGAWVSSYLHRPLPVDEPRVVGVEPGEGLSSVLWKLKGEGILGAAQEAEFRRLGARLYSSFTGMDSRLHVGEYQLNPGDSLLALLEKMDRGEVMQRSLTLVEGWNFRELRARLETEDTLTQTLEGLSDQEVMARLGYPDRHPEGWFAPETYFYTRGTSDLTVLKRALERQEAVLEQAWLEREEGLPYETAYDALVMASIVEKETGVPSERAEIAGVFVNRLRKGMRLQTDPTVIYGMGESYQGNIRRSDLRRPTPYNTYVIKGMPPTPIAMPGKDAIVAALHPAKTESLYFVARGDGSHYFSKTLAQHQKAVRDYQLRRREGYRSSPGASQ